MITTDSNSLLSDVREALRSGRVSQLGDRPGLPHLPEVETRLVDGEVILKVTVAPEERPGADAIPRRVQDALRSGGLTLAVTSDSTTVAASPVLALESGRAVRIGGRR
ncbi:hypothetical protein ACFYXF_03610 [Streptomyces sp. NPDC002680]|uniref:hypothetical protein n=1 Tax=Streptomyces sp. NPDC002680 TaxID=3364659 RepID=UPI00368BFCE5